MEMGHDQDRFLHRWLFEYLEIETEVISCCDPTSKDIFFKLLCA